MEEMAGGGERCILILSVYIQQLVSLSLWQ